jgi:hypothetical protein
MNRNGISLLALAAFLVGACDLARRQRPGPQAGQPPRSTAADADAFDRAKAEEVISTSST